MKSSSCFYILLAVILALPAIAAAAAKDDQLEFLHRMEKDGFADIAVDYLNDLKNDPGNAPPSIMRVWELEMSTAKRRRPSRGPTGPPRPSG